MQRKFYSIIFFLGLLLSCLTLAAQSDNENVPPFIREYLNSIKNDAGLKPFFSKLKKLESEKKGQINIVHIGDSHLQAGFISGEMRGFLQERFGNAGRGLIFPYKLASSNGPSDIKCQSTIGWKYNRLAHPEIPLSTGISGFCISKANAAGTLGISLKQDMFTNVQLFFLRNSKAQNALYNAGNGIQSGSLSIATDTTSLAPVSVELANSVSSFNIMFPPDNNRSVSFYGMSVTTNNPGIIYHSIGVNGARFASFNESDYFFKQLAYIPADLYIISLGTNEAQKLSLTENEMENDMTAFYTSLKLINPNAVILFTTPASSFYRNKLVNTKIEMVRNCIVHFANKEVLPYWDLFDISGRNSAGSWRVANLMANDGVHYNGKGYIIQGQLLFHALMKAYTE